MYGFPNTMTLILCLVFLVTGFVAGILLSRKPKVSDPIGDIVFETGKSEHNVYLALDRYPEDILKEYEHGDYITLKVLIKDL